MDEFQSFINKRKTKDLVVFRKRNVDKLFRTFIDKFPLVKAAGGLVVNEYNMVLMIYKNGTWDLPKGKR
ncbi:MAG: NUDIX hydrolase, partial [Bacteroidetes bacterium]|nr:NUDIX hydrolase [Bacteroidota bacterium]